jgi:catechol 2,3-dioxygenase-like lactoylglutathione lyase family enzyme
MAIAGFDHVAIPSERPEELIAFYARLGFSIAGAERWRAGEAPLFAIQFGEHKINIHPPALWQRQDFTLRGPAARPGCGDFCFVWDGDVAGLEATLQAAGAAIEVGPVPRTGGRGGGAEVGTSLYTRDPDGNLLEFIVYG